MSLAVNVQQHALASETILPKVVDAPFQRQTEAGNREVRTNQKNIVLCTAKRRPRQNPPGTGDFQRMKTSPCQAQVLALGNAGACTKNSFFSNPPSHPDRRLVVVTGGFERGLLLIISTNPIHPPRNPPFGFFPRKFGSQVIRFVGPRERGLLLDIANSHVVFSQTSI